VSIIISIEDEEANKKRQDKINTVRCVHDVYFSGAQSKTFFIKTVTYSKHKQARFAHAPCEDGWLAVLPPGLPSAG
jgi:hypothetical protein